MKRKAIVKTIIDIFAIIAMIALMFIVLFLFIKIPLWVMVYFDLVEKYANYPAIIIYGMEFVVIVVFSFIVWFIKILYKVNLEKLKND